MYPYVKGFPSPQYGSATYLSTSASSRDSQSNGVRAGSNGSLNGPSASIGWSAEPAVDRLLQPGHHLDRTGQHAERSGQHESGERAAVLLGVTQRDHRAERVAEQHDRPVGLLHQVIDVVDDAVVAARSEQPGAVGRTGVAVTAMVRRIRVVTGGGEAGGEARVPAAVFGRAVGDHHAPPSSALGRPVPVGDRDAVAVGERLGHTAIMA